MKVLLLGSGGREHAFAHSISKSKLCTKLYIAPGNAGTLNCGENVAVGVNDFDAIKDFVIGNQIELVVVGPEDPLVNGIVDYFSNHDILKNIPVIGPDKTGAQLEGSKDFSKSFMKKYSVPTAEYATFDSSTLNQGIEFLSTLQPPFVLKADGLAAGKGVLILNDLEEAKYELTEMLNGKFGKASTKVVIEEYLDGIEVSVFVLTDGCNYLILPEAKDYKRIGEKDTGKNTGGMGAVSPVPFVTKAFIDKVEQRIILPTIHGLKQEQINYKGFIFIGLMNVQGEPKVIEYNCRMGDPETEAVLPRIENDLLELLIAVGREELGNHTLRVSNKTATTVVMVSGGYPDAFEKGYEIEHLEQITESFVFHSGTKLEGEKVLTNGGRVLAVTSLGNDMNDALAKSYATAKTIRYDYEYYRKDIGQDLL